MKASRRRLVCACAGFTLARPGIGAAVPPQMREWHEAALAQRRLAESRGDQPFGAVVVMDGRIVAQSPSRVIERRDPDAHAERMAIRAAQDSLGRTHLDGAWLVSTSRPCAACEAAAFTAGITRMFHGEALTDAGAPRRAP